MPTNLPPSSTEESDALEPLGEYQPEPAESDFISSIDGKYDKWKQTRRPHEIQWFLNAAFFRGQHYVFWHDKDNRLAVPDAPTNRVRLPINRLQAKVRARMAKFLRNRAIPVVLPASSDLQSRMDARASTKALEYIWAKARMEAKYRDSLMWSAETDHGYWWVYWDPTIKGRVVGMDPLTKEQKPVDQEVGDVAVEVGSPFEVLIADASLSNIGDQPEIMRIKVRGVGELKVRYPEKGGFVKADVALGGNIDSDTRYDQKIAQLTPSGGAGTGGTQASDSNPTQVVVKEWFEKPTAQYPLGRYAVIAGGVLLRYQEELPFGFHDLPNPYPCIDFCDYTQVGQYWGSTILEQLIPIQKEYNLMRSKVAEHLRHMAFPKLLAARQHQIPVGVWTCVDEDTQVLTPSGWKNHATLAEGELIWSYDPATDKGTWLPNQHVLVQDAPETLYQMKSRYLDAVVTGNHRWLVQTRQPDRPQVTRFLTTEELLQEPRGKWSIPLAREGAPTDDPQSDKDAAFAELLGWIAAEGHLVANGSIVIAQSKQAGIEQLLALFARSDVPMTHTIPPTQRGMNRFYIPVGVGAAIQTILPDKVPTSEWIQAASRANLEGFLRGLMAGDGTVDKKSGHKRFSNNNLALCQAAQTIAALLGQPSTIRLSRPEHDKFFPAPYGNKTYHCAAQYMVHMGGPAKQYHRTNLVDLEIEVISGVGKRVWCPTVETGAVFFRRNNSIYVSGQCAAGEFVEYLAHPNIPPPQAWNPPNIASDVWRSIDGLKVEFDDVSHVYPEAEGRTGGATSGFQTNLLQEATDQVHAPDIRAHELCIEEAAWKLRRLMKQGYKEQRLITIAGRDMQPEVLEFSAEDIDENAEIRVQAGSALPQLKGARIQSVMELYNSGLLGDPADPEVRRRATTMIELSTVDDAFDYARKDEDEARIENASFEKGMPIPPPEFWENHQIHYRTHTDLLKGASTRQWPPEQRDLLIQHLILHVKYQNPMSAIELAQRYGHPELVQDLIAKLQAQAAQGVPPPGTAPQGPPPPQRPPAPPSPGSPSGGFGPSMNPPRAA